MTLFGYEPKTGHLFAWDKEFKYAGRVSCPPGDSFSPTNDVIASIIGGFFLGGVATFSKVFWSDGDNEVSAMAGLEMGGVKVHTTAQSVSLHDRVVLCGPMVSDPAKVALFCRRFPANSMSVCALTDELPAFGCLAEALCARRLDRPRRANLLQPVESELPFKFREFDKKLKGDGYGRMAHAVSLGAVVANDMMRGPGVSPFYGRLLAGASVFGQTIYIINSDCVEKFLKSAPVSMRKAARCVPVTCPVSDEFREFVRQDIKEAVVFVSGLESGLDDFLRFYGVMTKRGIVASGPVELEDMKGTLPVFRYNRVYAPEVPEYRETRNGLEGIL